GLAKIVHKLHHVVVRQGATFHFNAIPFDAQPHKPELERFKSPTDIIQDTDRARSRFFQLFDDAIFVLKQLLLLLEVLYLLDLLLERHELLLLVLFFSLSGLDLLIQHPRIVEAGSASQNDQTNRERPLGAYVPLRPDFPRSRSSE